MKLLGMFIMKGQCNNKKVLYSNKMYIFSQLLKSMRKCSLRPM